MDKTKCLLINPPQSYYRGNHEFNVYFPIGLYSIQSNTLNTKIDIYDCLVKNFQIKKHGHKIIYGSPLNLLIKHIQNTQPQIIGISCPFTAQFSNSIRTAKIIHQHFPKIKIILGGPAISFEPEKILQKFPFINFCLKGEGENIFSQLIKYIDQPQKLISTPNLVFLYQGKFINNPIQPILHLDSLLPINYSQINFNKYLHHPYIYKNRSTIPNNSFSIITSRGCPFQCNFCSINLHMTRVYRAHSPEYIFNQIKILHQQYHINNFHFEDDNVSQIPQRFEKLLDLIINHQLKINWDTPNGIRVDTLNPTLIQKIKLSGCVRLTIAIESGSQKTIDNVIKKHLNLAQAIKTIHLIHQHKIKLSAFFIIGFPQESVLDMKKTVNLAIKLFQKYQLYPMLFVAMPIPGTSLYQQCLKQKLLLHKIREKNIAQISQQQGKFLIKSHHHTNTDIQKCLSLFHQKTHPKFNFKLIIRKYILNPLFSSLGIPKLVHQLS